MPVQDGLTCTRNIRELERQGKITGGRLPIIAVSANARIEQILEAKEAGCDDVLIKPYRMPELLEKMRIVMGTVAHAGAGAAGVGAGAGQTGFGSTSAVASGSGSPGGFSGLGESVVQGQKHTQPQSQADQPKKQKQDTLAHTETEGQHSQRQEGSEEHGSQPSKQVAGHSQTQAEAQTHTQTPAQLPDGKPVEPQRRSPSPKQTTQTKVELVPMQLSP